MDDVSRWPVLTWGRSLRNVLEGYGRREGVPSSMEGFVGAW